MIESSDPSLRTLSRSSATSAAVFPSNLSCAATQYRDSDANQPHLASTTDFARIALMSSLESLIAPGRKVRIIQEITARHYSFTTPVEGTIVKIERRPTGSWYAHGEADKLWLDRIVLRKADGEITTISLDEHSEIVALDD